MRVIAFCLAIVAIAVASSAQAQTSQTRKNPPVYRSAAGTVIQPTRTIIHHPDGTTTIIVQRRSYLDPGTEVPVGYGSHMDYAFPPGGDPGRPYWFYGPDQHGIGGLPLAQPFLLPGINQSNPF
jgi:hypothetical protein